MWFSFQLSVIWLGIIEFYDFDCFIFLIQGQLFHFLITIISSLLFIRQIVLKNQFLTDIIVIMISQPCCHTDQLFDFWHAALKPSDCRHYFNFLVIFYIVFSHIELSGWIVYLLYLFFHWNFIILLYVMEFQFGFGLDEWDSNNDIFKSGKPALVLYRESFANQPTIMGCFNSKPTRQYPGKEDPVILASQTACKSICFSVKWCYGLICVVIGLWAVAIGSVYWILSLYAYENLLSVNLHLFFQSCWMNHKSVYIIMIMI